MDEVKEFVRLAGDNELKMTVCPCGYGGDVGAHPDGHGFRFRDQASYDRYGDLGMCQRCQDVLYRKGDPRAAIEDIIARHDGNPDSPITTDRLLALKFSVAMRPLQEELQKCEGIETVVVVQGLMKAFAAVGSSFLDTNKSFDEQLLGADAMGSLFTTELMACLHGVYVVKQLRESKDV